MRIVRTVLAVAIGFGVVVVGATMIWGAPTDQRGPTYFLGSIGYGVVFAALGGLAAASLGGQPYLRHAAGVAALIVLGAGVDAVLGLHPGLRWFDGMAVLLMAPAALAGGWARQWVTRKQTPDPGAGESEGGTRPGR